MHTPMLVYYALPLTAILAGWWHSTKATKPKRSIQDEVVVIVGASSGVGLEVAKLYASQSRSSSPKAAIHMVARSPSLLQVAKEIEVKTGCNSIHTHVADACSEKDLSELFRSIRQMSGKIDTLVFCAGALTTSGFMELEDTERGEDLEKNPATASTRTVAAVAKASYDANVLSCMLTIKALVPLLEVSPRPRIAAISSVAAELPAPTRSIYAAHKAALSMFLRCLRIELDGRPAGGGSKFTSRRGKGGIGISIIHPASIKTGLRGKALDFSTSGAHSAQPAARVQEHEKGAMSAGYVAEQVKRAVDCEIDELWLPGWYWWVAKVGMIVAPDLIVKKAKKKYDWHM